jgi:membrane protein YqaA with SNARE-associated domain
VLDTIQAFVRPRGDRRWDLFLRATGLMALAAIPLAIYCPQKIPLVTFVLVALPACGPWSPVIPIAFEPLIFEVSKYESPLWVAGVALGICLYTEYVNWHIYRWIVSLEALAKVRRRRFVQLAVTYFGRSPFVTVVIAAMAPFPFWVIRVLAILKPYPLRRYLVAMAMGRAPRLLLLAWLGAQLQFSSVILMAVVAGAAMAAIIISRTQRSEAAASVA